MKVMTRESKKRSMVVAFLVSLVHSRTYALELGNACLNRDEGTTATFACPCTTGVGSFSKSDEKGTIWSNGIIAKDKRDRFLFENNSVIIQDLVPSDQGEFVWVCDETYWEKSACLTVRAHAMSISAQPSNDRLCGENMTITVTSNFSSKVSFVSCRFSPKQDCSDDSSLSPLYNSNIDANIQLSARKSQPRIVKRSALDFDMVFDTVSKDDEGCYVCQEMVLIRPKSSSLHKGRTVEVKIAVLNHKIWQRKTLAALTAVVVSMIVIITIAICLAGNMCIRKEVQYLNILKQNHADSLMTVSSHLKPQHKYAIQLPNQVKTLYVISEHNPESQQRELEKYLIKTLCSEELVDQIKNDSFNA